MYLGDRQVQYVGDHGHVGLVDVPELLGDGMQYRHQGAPEPAQLGRNLPHALCASGSRDGGGGHYLTGHVYNIPCPGSGVKAMLPMT